MTYLIGYVIICMVFSAAYCYVGYRSWRHEHASENQTVNIGGGWSQQPTPGL